MFNYYMNMDLTRGMKKHILVLDYIANEYKLKDKLCGV